MLIGGKNFAWFDLWSIQHFSAGVIVGTFFRKRNYSITRAVIITLVSAYLWELIEYSDEIGLFGQLPSVWFGGVEFFWNRILMDPFLFTLGMFLGFYSTKRILHQCALLFVVIWLLLNMFSENSNQFQVYIFNLVF